MHLDHEDLLEQVNKLIEPYGCRALDLGEKSVGVQGDGRVHGPSVFIEGPPGMSSEEMGKIATEIINKVKGLTRVLWDITTFAQS